MNSFTFKLLNNIISDISEDSIYNQELFEEITKFIYSHQIMPSLSTVEFFKNSELCLRLQLPEYLILQSHIGLDASIYDALFEAYSNFGQYNYLYNSGPDTEMEIFTDTQNKSTCLYVGQFSLESHIKEGAGIWVSSNGELYEGYWKHGEKHYHGRTIWVSGEMYEGEYKNGLMHGHGEYLFANGERYVGSFKQDQKWRQGKMIYKSGAIETGYWINDKLVGNSTILYLDGSSEIIWNNELEDTE